MVLPDQVVLHYFIKDKICQFSLQINELSLENLMDVIYPYKSTSRLSLYILTIKLIFYLKSTQSTSQDKNFVFQDLSFQIYFSNSQLFQKNSNIPHIL